MSIGNDGKRTLERSLTSRFEGDPKDGGKTRALRAVDVSVLESLAS